MKIKLLLPATALAVAALMFPPVALAKLPAPSDEAKAKAAEAAAKTAHAGKVDNYKLCQTMDKVAAQYFAAQKKAGKDTKPATATAACEDPGAFVYPPPAPGTAVAAATPPGKAASGAKAAAPAAKAASAAKGAASAPKAKKA
jgi:hypothetical protein